MNNEYIESRGYLVRRGESPSNTGFILPKNKAEKLGEMKRQAQKAFSPDMHIVKIKKLCGDIHKNSDAKTKKDFMFNVLCVENFEDLRNKTEDFLNKLLDKLNKQAREND